MTAPLNHRKVGEPHFAGRYLPLEEIRTGCGSRMLRGADARTSTVVALKIVPFDEHVERHELFRREIAILRRIGGRHGVVQLLDDGRQPDGTLWCALEWIDGESLERWLRHLWDGEASERGRRQADVLWTFAQLASALDFLHGEGVVHADVSPRNVLIRPDGRPVLVDFGNARTTAWTSSSRETAQAGGEVGAGTPGFMPPEQILGSALDARGDLYALGCLLYQAFTGQPVFRAANAEALLRQHLEVRPSPPSTWCPDIPPALDELVLGLLAKDVFRRIGHAHDVATMLASLAGRDASALVTHQARPVRLYRPRFAGRSAPLEALGDGLARACAGSGQLFLIAGESGAGKTRLANELGGLAAARGADTLFGTCVEVARDAQGRTGVTGAPLHPLTTVLDRLADWARVAPVAQRERLARHFALLLPYATGLASTHRDSAGGFVVAERTPARVVQALTESLQVLSLERPVLVIVDDLQWADELTLAFLQNAAAGVFATCKVFLVGTYRLEQSTPELEALGAACGEHHLVLGRMDLDEIKTMIQDMLAAQTIPPGVIDVVYRQSEGNAFLVAECLRAMVDQGQIQRNGQVVRQTMAPSPSRPDDLEPRSLRALFTARMTGLSPSASQVLELAAVLGRDFDIAAFEAIYAEPTAGAVSNVRVALAELTSRQVLGEVSPGYYRFAHDKLREAQEEAIPGERRRELHRRIAEYLQRLPPSDDAAAVAQIDASLGVHWAAAKEAGLAMAPLLRAARHAQGVYANGQAAQLFGAALEQAVAVGDPRSTLDIGEALADVLVQAARHDEARERYRRTRSQAASSDRVRVARLARKLSQSFWTLHEYGEASEHLDLAEAALGSLDTLDSSEALGEWLEIQRCRFFLLYFSRQVGERTRDIILRMGPIVEEHGDESQRSSYYQCAAMEVMARTRYEHTAEAIVLARRALAEADKRADLAIQSNEARFTLGLALALGGPLDCVEAIDVLEASAAEAARTEAPTLRSRALAYLALAYRRLGDAVRTRNAAEEALRAADTAQLSPYRASAMASLAWVAWRRGDLGNARQQLAEAEALWAKSPHAFPFRWQTGLVMMDLCHKSEDLAQAQAIARDLLHPQQQCLPQQLQQVMATFAAASPDGEAAAAWEAFDRILALALELRFL